jgi:predicted metalloprotease with PDZ domain
MSFRLRIDLRNASTHRLNISLEADKGQSLPTELAFPVWTPGSYMVRDYSRHITRLSSGKKVSKNVWSIPAGTKRVSYEVYCFERTVRTNYCDENYCSLVGAALAPVLAGPLSIELLLPKDWSMVSSALNFRKAGPGKFQAKARDIDHWIDCPIIASRKSHGGKTSFTLSGIPHEIAWVGSPPERSLTEMKEAFRKISSTTLKFFGGAPFKKYWFLLHFGSGLYGGLEHRDSQLSQFDGSSLANQKMWDGFLRLIAHEYFHSWNVKSLRPKALGPFDYFQENYTEEIWLAEGLTDYFDDYISWKSGLCTEKNYWESRLKDINLMPDGFPGHIRRSLAESSFDAWIRHYRPDEDTVNTDVSYYIKGGLLGWCWDGNLRRLTKGKWTLAKLFAEFWKEIGVDAYVSLATATPGYTRAQLLSFAKEKTGVDHGFLEKWVSQRSTLPWQQAIKDFQLKTTERISDPTLHFLGLQLNWKERSGSISKVIAGSAGESAALAVNDEIIALNGTRVQDGEKFSLCLQQARKNGAPLELTVCRGDQLSTKRLRWRAHRGLGLEIVLL